MAENPYDPEETQLISLRITAPVTLSRSDMIALRDDVHGATERARRWWISLWHTILRAELAADAVSSVPLLGSGDDWWVVKGTLKPGTHEPDRIEVCDWRASLDSHCRCFRCWGQDDAVKRARQILYPCADVANCYSCRMAGVDCWTGDPYAKAGRELAARTKLGAQRTKPRQPSLFDGGDRG